MLTKSREGITKSVSELAGFLNDSGFEIPVSKCTKFINSFNDSEIDIINKDDVLGMMRTCFCTTPAQTIMLEELIGAFINRQNTVKVESTKRETLEEKRNAILELFKQEEELRQIKKNKFAEFEKTYTFSVKATKDELKKLKKQEQDGNELAGAIADGIEVKNWEKFFEICPSESSAVNKSQKVQKSCEDKLFKGDASGFKQEKILLDVLKRTISSIWGKDKEKKIKVLLEENSKDENERIKEINKERERLEEEVDFVQAELENSLKAAEECQRIISKYKSAESREEFISGHNFVSSQSEGALNTQLDKEFMKLSDKEKDDIYCYIKENALKFKTRMARRIKCENRHEINMQETIAHACRTMGEPLELIYQRPHANKANIVLMLDISGSCSKASEMMLSFMYIFQSVFPKGCKAFAFVNNLYDISGIMKAEDVKSAIKNVKNTIPTKGVYSDYCSPLRDLWTKHHNDISSDSIVIFIGDARNNGNDTGEEYLRNISRRAKKCYWINTEYRCKWSEGDSAANIYGKYARMYEVTTSGGLLGFLSTI